VQPPSNDLTRNSREKLCGLSASASVRTMRRSFFRFFLFLSLFLLIRSPSFATTKGLSEIITPDLQPEGDLSLSFQRQDSLIGNPYQLQAEAGLTSWAEAAVFKGFQPNELIFGAEFGLLRTEPWLLSTGFANWSPHSHVDPQPYLIGGYYTEHHKFIAGAIHAGFRNEAILGYAYDFNKQWRAQVDFQSGSGNSVAFGFTWNITPNFQTNPAVYVTNDKPHKLLGYVVFTYTFHLWKGAETKKDPTVPGG
jgi:hypothetical protein